MRNIMKECYNLAKSKRGTGKARMTVRVSTDAPLKSELQVIASLLM